MKALFWKLDKLGRVRLSQNFQFRQFLYSEIAIANNIVNIPSDEKLAVEAGRMLCTNILEPIIEEFGPIIVRSGYRSVEVNNLGNQNRLMCAANEKNYGYHIWDYRDAGGFMGAAACILIPQFNAGETNLTTWQDLAWWIDANLPYHRLTFFKRDNAFNIGWHENPKREIYSWNPKAHWLKR